MTLQEAKRLFREAAISAAAIARQERGSDFTGKVLEDIVCDIYQENPHDFAGELAYVAGKFYVNTVAPLMVQQ